MSSKTASILSYTPILYGVRGGGGKGSCHQRGDKKERFFHVLLRRFFAEKVIGCRAAIHQKIAAADIAAIAAHDKFRQRADFIRGAAVSGGQVGEHGAVEILAFAVQFVVGKRGEDDAGADAVQPRAAFAPAHRFGGDAQCIAALRDLVGAASRSRF